MNDQQPREEAGNRFLSDPTKCYQRHIREVYDELEARPKLTSLSGARIVSVSNEEAATIITKYEWLRTMGEGTQFCYGLKLNDELLGVSCFQKTTRNARSTQLTKIPAKTICLCRGACVPHAPKDSGSFLTRHACRLAFKDHGYEVVFAFSDPAAGEIGTIYQAVGWKYLGLSDGTVSTVGGAFYHTIFKTPDGKMLKDPRQYSKYAEQRGYTEAVQIYWKSKDENGKSRGGRWGFLKSLGCAQIIDYDRNRWVWFEGPRKNLLEAACCYNFLPYPKRAA
jgi:hypothetical protein